MFIKLRFILLNRIGNNDGGYGTMSVYKRTEMKRIIICAIVFMAIAAAPAGAVTRSGNDMLVDCRNLIDSGASESLSKEKVLGVGYCIGLIDGFVTYNYVYEAVLQVEKKGDLVQMCLPERVSTRQLAEVVITYLEKNPDRLQESGQALAAQALIASYPCDQRKSE